MSTDAVTYAMLINLDRCIGCYACQVTCKAEYDLPFGTSRCRVETIQSGNYPRLKKFFLPRLCNQCDHAPCIETCEQDALFKNRYGIVQINSEGCTGCQMCSQKCPYNAIEIDPFSGRMQKCDFCFDRITKGESPVCVQSCMGKAMIFGDMNDRSSEIFDALKRYPIMTLNPEFSTDPAVFYAYSGELLHAPLKTYKRPSPLPSTPRVRSISSVKPNLSGQKIIYSSDAMCPSECGIAVLVEDGIARKIYGNPHTLVNNRAFCAKGASGLQLTYSPYRIRTPLIRDGQRGEDRWRKVTWGEASSHIAKKLVGIKHTYGAESVFLDCGDVTDREALYRLFHAFGTPNIYNHGSICDPNRRWGGRIMIGDERPLPDIQRPFLTRDDRGELYLRKDHDIKLLLHAGVNPFVATRFNYMSAGIPAARQENGCTYIVVDPAFTNSASHADIWLPINPGADAALLAAIFCFIITHDSPDDLSRKYMDHEFLDQYTTGWQEFRDAFLAYTTRADPSNGLCYFTPEWAEDISGISARDIRRVSHLFGSTKPAAIEIGMHGASHHSNGDVSSILATALCLITGNLDRPGGLVLIESQKARKGDKASGKEFLQKQVSRQINGMHVSGGLFELHKDLFGDYPAAWKGVLTDLPRKIREGVGLKYGPFKDYSYPVKALFSRAGNPVMTAGNTSDWIDALTAKDERGDYRLELMVCIDTHISDTGKYADIMLPEAGFLERMGASDVYTMSPEIAIRDQVIKPLYESKTPFEIMKTLASALIQNRDPDIIADDFDRYASEESFVNEILSESPGFYNFGTPLPYPDLPEGSLIIGVPDNPTAVFNDKVIRKGEPLTVQWLREHNGVAVWPAGYYRYRMSNGRPSGVYPLTSSGKFEFRFSLLERLNEKTGTAFPATFYWSDCRWNPKNIRYSGKHHEYPFQLTSGRSHYAMTVTAVCPYIAVTETECMKKMNNPFHFTMPGQEGFPNKYGFPEKNTAFLDAGDVGIPVFAINRGDGENLNIKTGQVITLENPFGQQIAGKAFLTAEVMPGVIKTAFGPGGQRASGMGFIRNICDYTPNINALHDPDNFNSFTGAPGFGDIMVKVILPPDL